jgi:5-methylcytosine-specific restriction endonuclease McrA
MNLNHLTDDQLIKDSILLADRERSLLSEILWHLKEIDNRRLYSDLRCSSLFDYCVKVMKYSEGQASRRVSACRMLIAMPEIISDIKMGELNLTQLNQAKNFFDEEEIQNTKEKKEVLEKLKGKTTRETEKILWGLKKESSPRRVNLYLLEQTVESLEKLKALKAHSCPDMDSLIMKMSQEVNKLWDPTIVLRNRKKTAGDSRYVQVGLKAKIWKNDKGKCSNCDSIFALEVDHLRPYAVGGKTKEENLRLLCRSCNQRKSLVYFGKKKFNFK